MASPLPARIVLALGLLGLGVAVINQLSAPQLDPPLEREQRHWWRCFE